MVVELINDWKHYKAGRRLVLDNEGVGNILVKRGLAKHVGLETEHKQSDSSDAANVGASHNRATAKATGTKPNRHSAR